MISLELTHETAMLAQFFRPHRASEYEEGSGRHGGTLAGRMVLNGISKDVFELYFEGILLRLCKLAPISRVMQVITPTAALHLQLCIALRVVSASIW